MNPILLLHIFTTLFMCGLCWFVQIVHYPLFKEIAVADFPAYQKKNYATGLITVPVMTIELFSGIWFLYTDYSPLFLVNIVLLVLIWGSTFVFQVPTHLQLVKTPTHALMDKLIRTNWIRTVCWSVRVLLLGYLVVLRWSLYAARYTLNIFKRFAYGV